ncbi:MAG: hypothetical protein AAGF12_24650 [Myxococcota bacterium]
MSELKRLQQEARALRIARQAVEREVRSKQKAHQTLDTAVQSEVEVARTIRELGDPRNLVASLNKRVPVVLFPLRLETRFKRTDAGPQLWIRAYPDDCQIQTHTAYITEAELEAVRRFWVDWYRAGGLDNQQRSAWRQLILAHGSGRAPYLLESVRPEGEPPTKARPEDTVLVIVGPGPSPEHRAAADAYWIARWRAGRNQSERLAARETLVAAIGEEGAATIEATDEPENLDEAPPAPFTRENVGVQVERFTLPPPDVETTSSSWNAAPRATTLPERLVIQGLRESGDGYEVMFEELGDLIPPTLDAGPDPSLPEDKQLKSENGVLAVNDGLRWLTDFDAAVAKGMAIRIDLDEVTFQRGLDRLVVLGVRFRSDAQDGEELLEELFRDHHRSRGGLSILPQGTPTNNTDEADAGYTWVDDPDASFDRVFGDASTFPLSDDPLQKRDGQWLAEILGLDPAAFRTVGHADGLDQAHARAMNTALFPATLGYYLDAMLDGEIDTSTIERVRQFFVRYVSGRGAAPPVRIGKQPYGILPTTVFSRLSLYDGPASVPIPQNELESLAAQPIEKTSAGRPIRAIGRTGAASLLTPERATQLGVSFNTGPFPFDFLFRLKRTLGDIDKYIQYALPSVPHVGQRDEDPHQVLLDVLGLHPTSVEFHQRLMRSVEQVYNEVRIEQGEAAATLFVGLHENIIKSMLSFLGHSTATDVPLLDQVFDGEARRMRGTVVTAFQESEYEVLGPATADGRNYLEWLAGSSLEVLRREDFGGEAKPRSLLYLVGRQALLRSFWSSGVAVLAEKNLVDANAMRREPVFQAVSSELDGPSRWLPLLSTEPAVTGDGQTTLGEYLLRPEAAQSFPKLTLPGVRAAFQRLSTASTASLGRLFAEHVDICSYRLDAWKLGLVHHRLRQMRDEAPRGAYLGAYGFLENVRPEGKTLRPADVPRDVAPFFDDPRTPTLVTDPTNAGFIHAPSADHATAAAVLRNGYLTHASPSEPDRMAINLTSARVRAAKQILQGVARGQQLNELLGYQFERGLHDSKLNGVEVEKFKLALRKKFPLTSNKIKLTAVFKATSLEAREPRSVLDGVKLAEHLRTHNPAYPFGFSVGNGPDDLPPATAAEAAAITEEARRLADTNDAVADLLLSESVYQVLRGQTERGGAAAEVVGRGRTPPELEVIQTPRGGMGLLHRVAIHFDVSAAPPTTESPRAIAEPALEAWLGKRFPLPQDVQARVAWRDGAAEETRWVSQADLGLSATDLLHALVFESRESHGLLDDRIEGFLRRSASLEVGTRVDIHYEEASPGAVSFIELAAWVRQLRPLLTSSRSLVAGDLSRPDSGISDPGLDLDELTLRIEAAIASLEALAGESAALDGSAAPAEDRIEETSRLLEASALHGIPGTRTASFQLELHQAIEKLRAKARAVETRWTTQLAAFDALASDIAALDPGMAVSRLAEAEAKIARTVTAPPPDVASYQALLGEKRNAFSSALVALRSELDAPAPTLEDLINRLEPWVASMERFDAVWFDLDREQNDLAAERTKLRTVAADAGQRLAAARRLMDARIREAETVVAEARDEAEPRTALRKLEEASKLVLGDEARVVPRVRLPEDAGDELESAYADRASILGHLEAQGREFPVDEWLYGVARVREPMGRLSRAFCLEDHLGRTGSELSALQLPYRPDDSWTGLEIPEGYDLNEEKLLYTASLEGPVRHDDPVSGLVIDEWTEVIPHGEEISGVTFHYDRPNSEPMQSILVACPPQLLEGWRFDDLIACIGETVDQAKLRAIEPRHVAQSGYSPFLPATLFPMTKRRELIMGLDLSLNDLSSE